MVSTSVSTIGNKIFNYFLGLKKSLVTVGITCGKMRHMEGNELQRRRDALGMSRDELAKALSTTSVSIWRWENGERGIPPYLELALETIERERKASPAKATQATPKPKANGATKKAAKKGGKK